MNLFLLIFVDLLKSNRWGSILHNRTKRPVSSRFFLLRFLGNIWSKHSSGLLFGRKCYILFLSFLITQVFIFHVESHPEYPWYEQCVTFNSFPTRAHEIVYAAFGMTMMYVLPLVVFIFTYGSILCEISQRSKESNKQQN